MKGCEFAGVLVCAMVRALGYDVADPPLLALFIFRTHSWVHLSLNASVSSPFSHQKTTRGKLVCKIHEQLPRPF